MQRLFERYRHKGMSMWWCLVELIAENSGQPPTGKILISEQILAKELRVTVKVVTDFLHFCETNVKLTCNKNGTEFHIELPKLLEIKDDYSRKSGQSTNKVPSNRLEEKRREKKREEKKREEKKRLRAQPKSKPFYMEGELLTLGDGQNVLLNSAGYESLKEKYTTKKVDDKISYASTYFANHPNKYKDHYLTLNSWLKKEADALKPKGSAKVVI